MYLGIRCGCPFAKVFYGFHLISCLDIYGPNRSAKSKHFCQTIASSYEKLKMILIWENPTAIFKYPNLGLLTIVKAW